LLLETTIQIKKMKLSEIKSHLSAAQAVNFLLPDGNFVPAHFHVTELGLVTKIFIDCGGTLRNEKVVNFQLWSARDFEHRLDPKKLLNIISLSENNLGLGDLEIEVEYQSDTIGKYSLDFFNQKTNRLFSKRPMRYSTRTIKTNFFRKHK